MDVQKYLEDLVTKVPNFELSSSDEKTIKFEGIEKYIFNKLNSSQFKASSIPEELTVKIKDKISKSVHANEPIHITIPFGGYKKWQLPTYPNPDWAEVFYLVLLREYLTPIAVAYKHGVLLEFFSDEIFVSRMNNYPQSDLDSYNDQFEEILKWFSRYLPKNFNVKFSKIRDQISQEELMKRFDKDIEKLEANWEKVTEEERVFRLKKTERNYKDDLSKYSKEERDKILLESTLVHDAFIFGDWDKDVPWAFGEKMIALGNRYTGKWGIHVKSSRASTVQFWIGTAVLKEHKGLFIPSTLTYKQYLEAKLRLQELKVKVFPREFENLRKIYILK